LIIEVLVCTFEGKEYSNIIVEIQIQIQWNRYLVPSVLCYFYFVVSKFRFCFVIKYSSDTIC